MERHLGQRLFLPIIFCLIHGNLMVEGSQPHIIIILADDLGYNDVGYNANLSAVMTPNIDALANEGVKLANYYVQPQCTPTRSQLMTGRYQTRTGMQHGIIHATQPLCLPLDEITMAQKLKENGYTAHLVGKWHLGFYQQACVPTSRGFDTFLGFYTDGEDYYSHQSTDNTGNVEINAYDFRRGVDVAWAYAGNYSTYTFEEEAKHVMREHDPSTPMFMFISMQAPHPPLEVDQKYRALYDGIIENADRKTVAGQISCMDEAIGNIVNALKEHGYYDNSVILFSSDNGAAVDQYGSNWPLRGGMDTFWEGGTRAVGFIHSPLLPEKTKGSSSHALIHVSDWFPTFVSSLAGGSVSDIKLDGVDVWDAISDGTSSPRDEILHNIDPLFPKNAEPIKNRPFDSSIRAALRKGDWKIITGDPGSDWNWTPSIESGLRTILTDEPLDKHLWLFNITNDPTEMNDVSEENPTIVHELLIRLQYHYENMVEPIWTDERYDYDPADHGGVWEPWA